MEARRKELLSDENSYWRQRMAQEEALKADLARQMEEEMSQTPTQVMTAAIACPC